MFNMNENPMFNMNEHPMFNMDHAGTRMCNMELVNIIHQKSLFHTISYHHGQYYTQQCIICNLVFIYIIIKIWITVNA